MSQSHNKTYRNILTRMFWLELINHEGKWSILCIGYEKNIFTNILIRKILQLEPAEDLVPCPVLNQVMN